MAITVGPLYAIWSRWPVGWRVRKINGVVVLRAGRIKAWLDTTGKWRGF